MSHFKKYAPAAKRLYKTGRYKSYAEAMKAAMKKAPVKKAAAKKVVRKKNVAAPKRKKVGAVVSGMGSIGSMKSQIKKVLKEKAGNVYVEKMLAKTKTEKRKLQKVLSETLREMKKY